MRILRQKKEKINTCTHHYTYICSWIWFWYTEIILLKFKIKFTPPKKIEKMNIHLYPADLSLPAWIKQAPKKHLE